MDTRQVAKPINTFINALPKTVQPSQVIIFGSQNDGTAAEDSDIDIVVVSKDFEKISEDKRLDILYRASRFISPEIHPWGVTPEELSAADNQSTLGTARKFGGQFI